MIGEIIVDRAKKMGIPLPEDARGKFQTYYEMLVSANEKFNLARGLEDESEATDRHFLDSLSLIPAARPRPGARIIDVGSGAGFPGIPLAIARPDLDMVLLDALAKRAAFLNDVIQALNLNARAIHARCEDAGRNPLHRERYDLACARAVAALPALCEWLSPFVRPGGHAAAFKGPTLDDELGASQNALRETRLCVAEVRRAPIPGRDWDHRILLLTKTAPLSPRYPRKPAEAARKPL